MNGICVTYDGITKHCRSLFNRNWWQATKEMLPGYNWPIHLPELYM